MPLLLKVTVMTVPGDTSLPSGILCEVEVPSDEDTIPVMLTFRLLEAASPLTSDTLSPTKFGTVT